MKATFERAARFTMAVEGGDRLSDHAADPGGLTKYGISQQAYPALDIAALSEAEALELYRRDYWDRIAGDELPWPLDLAVFDYAFNAGPGQAIRDLQRVLAVPADGVLGPRTLAAVKSCGDPLAAASRLNGRRLVFLARLPNWPDFDFGWSRRVLDLQGEIFKP